MRAHGAFGDAEPMPDLLVAMAFGEQLEHFDLSRGERRDAAILLIETGAAREHGLDPFDHVLRRLALADEADRAAGLRAHPRRGIFARRDQHQWNVRMARPQFLHQAETVAPGQPGVDDHHVRTALVKRGAGRVRAIDASHRPCWRQRLRHAREPLAKQRMVLDEQNIRQPASPLSPPEPHPAWAVMAGGSSIVRYQR